MDSPVVDFSPHSMEVAAFLINRAGRAAAATSMAALFLVVAPFTLAQTVSTLAGTGVPGYVDGPGNVAQFNLPLGVAVDSSGNVYVPDYVNSRVRKITPAGVVSTFAGTGVQGHVDGPANVAQFNLPNSVAVDGSNNVYVFDYTTHYLRKITPAGMVSTLAGSGFQGSADGTGSAASFYNPTGIAADSAGNIYVGDINNFRIRKVSPAGVVTTLAGPIPPMGGFVDGLGPVARFRGPQGMAVDSSGNVYVADVGNYAIRKITPSGLVSTLAGLGVAGHVDGPSSVARFELPSGVAVDGGGNVYVTDKNYIRKVTPAGIVSTFAGTGVAGFADGPALTVAKFATPPSVTVDVSGNIYVADAHIHRVRKIASLTAPSVCVAPPNTTMVAWYPFDETSGTTAANLATGNIGTLINSPTHVPGKVAGALRFDGNNDYVESPSTIVTNIGPAGLPQTCSGAYSTCMGDFSLDAWIKLDPAASFGVSTIVDKRNGTPPLIKGYLFFVYVRDRLGIQLADGVGPGYGNYISPVIAGGLIGSWHHVAVTVSRRTSPAGIKWYDNGVLIGSSNPTLGGRYGSLVNNSPLRIGRDSYSGGWFKGDIDELEVFNRELTPAEVQGIYHAGPAGKCKRATP